MYFRSSVKQLPLENKTSWETNISSEKMQLDRYGDKSLEVVLKKDGNQEEKIITEMTN